MNIALTELEAERTRIESKLSNWGVGRFSRDTSLSLLPLQRAGRRASDVLLIGSTDNVYGDRSLPDVPQQLADVARIWTEPGARELVSKELAAGDTLDDSEASLERWDRFDILHIICRGHVPEQRPFDAALRLGAETLRVSELFAHRLGARVMCSARARSAVRRSSTRGST